MKIIILLLAIIGAIALLMFAYGLLQDWRIVPHCESGPLGSYECYGWFGRVEE